MCSPLTTDGTTTSSEKIVIDYDTAKRIAAELVAERGRDYIYVDPNGVRARKRDFGEFDTPYVSCVNWDNSKNEPSCIVGHILHRAGVPERIIKDRRAGISDDFDEYYKDDVVETFLSRIQSHQDCGMPWGEALDEASHWVENELE